MSLNIDLIKSKNMIEALMTVILSIFFALITIALMLVFLNNSGMEISTDELIKYAFTDIINDPSNLAQALYWSTPLLMTGLSVAIAFQAGLFNIGSQGQMTMGASSAGIWAAAIVPHSLTFLDTPILLIPTTMFVGIIMGGIWGYIPGYLKAEKDAHEVIVTILMNLIALTIVRFLVGSRNYSPYVDKSSTDAYNQTEAISSNARINLINPEFSTFLDYTIIVAVIVMFILQFMLYKTNFGYKIRAVGLNSKASEVSGINSKKIVKRSMFLSGGVAGLGGALLVMGEIRYYAGIEYTFGFDGIAVALIGQNIPFATGISAILFGLLFQSRINLGENTEIPPEIIIALQAWIVLFIAAPLIARKVISLYKQFIEKDDEINLLEDNNSSDEQDVISKPQLIDENGEVYE